MIDIETIVKLKDSGMSASKIAKYLSQQGINISKNTIRIKLAEYYEKIGEEKTRGKRIDLPIEEIIRLKEEGMTDKEIAEYFAKQGIKICVGTLNSRLIKYYNLVGKEKPRAGRNIDELIRLKEQGLSDSEIAKILSEQGREIKANTVRQRLYKYYKSIGQETSKRNRIDIPIEDVIRLKEEGKSYKEIKEYLAIQGINVTEACICKKLTKIYRSNGKKVPKAVGKSKENQTTDLIRIGRPAKKYDDTIKYILMNGITMNEYISETGKEEERENIELTLRKLRFLAQHIDKKDGKWVEDNNFDILLSNVQSNNITSETQEKVSLWVKDGKCKKRNFKVIKELHFGGSVELTVYFLTRLNLLYANNEAEEFEILRTQYEQKIDEYLDKLHTIEENIAKNKAECYELGQ